MSRGTQAHRGALTGRVSAGTLRGFDVRERDGRDLGGAKG